jgi:hypothetical protein
MSLFRYLFSLFANLVMIVLGGFLTYMGGLGLILTLQIYLFLETELPGGKTMNQTLGELNGGEMDMFGDATPWLIMFGELLVGLPLLVFGVRGLLRRLKGGLPDEEEGLPETSAGRIGQDAVFLAGGLAGLVLLSSTLFKAYDYVSHVTNSARAEAIIEKRWRSGGTADEINGQYYVTYRFNTHAGEAFVSKAAVPNFGGKAFTEGNKIIVTYRPDDPKDNEWEELRSLSDYLFPFVMYTALVVGGLWGVKRNLLDEPEYA